MFPECSLWQLRSHEDDRATMLAHMEKLDTQLARVHKLNSRQETVIEVRPLTCLTLLEAEQSPGDRHEDAADTH